MLRRVSSNSYCSVVIEFFDENGPKIGTNLVRRGLSRVRFIAPWPHVSRRKSICGVSPAIILLFVCFDEPIAGSLWPADRLFGKIV